MSAPQYTTTELKAKRKTAHEAAMAARSEAYTALDNDETGKANAAMERFKNAHAKVLSYNDAIKMAEQELAVDSALADLDLELGDSEREGGVENQYNNAFMAFVNGAKKPEIAEAYGEEVAKAMYFSDEANPGAKFKAAQSTSADNTAVIPASVVRTLDKIRVAYGGLVEFATTINTSHGREVGLPYFDRPKRNRDILLGKTDKGGEGKPQFNVAESQTIEDTEPFTTDKLILHSHKNTSGIAIIPHELGRDSIINFIQLVVTELAEDLFINEALKYAYSNPGAVNDTSAKPQGLIDYLERMSVVPANSPVGLWWVGGTGANYNAKKWYISWQDIVRLPGKVSAAYRGASSARFFFSDDLLHLLMTLTDDNNRPVWQPSVRVGEPDTFRGRRYVIGHSIELTKPTAVDNSQFVMGFGDMSKVVFRRVGGYRMKVGQTVKRDVTANKVTDTFRTDETAYMLISEHDMLVRPHPAFAAMMASGNATAADEKLVGTYGFSAADVVKGEQLYA